MRPRHLVCGTCAALLAAAPQARATWSIVLADSDTREVAAGTVTCLTNFDLLALVPVAVVGKGAGAVQSAGDFNGVRRPVIFQQLQLGTPPQDILQILEGIAGHQDRQYGIVDTRADTVTFSGANNSPWAGGVTGSACSLYYAIQGNILAGDCVVPAIEQAIRDTPGDLPARLMAGMQAARELGGDGRCSCSMGNPTGCGCPPLGFSKSGHIGGMVVARIGDTDDPDCDADGCVDGDYFMRLNVPFQTPDDPDPVEQLQIQFDDWRAALAGRPDAIHTAVWFDPPAIPPDGVSQTLMHIQPLDWQGRGLNRALRSLTVRQAEDSAGISTIGPLTDHGDGTFGIPLTAGARTGVDRFIVTLDDGIRAVVLMPEPAFEYCTTEICQIDCNANGVPDLCDIGSGTTPDCNGNGFPDDCDVALGFSSDCGDSGNGIPDDCEPDCNRNGTADSCDIALGRSPDRDGNGVPDECHAILRVPLDFAAIQPAIDAARPGDTVWIADGTYRGPANRDLDPAGKAILIKSEHGPGNCIIDCAGAGRGVLFDSGETRDTILEGLTITQGRADFGAAVRCVQGSSPTIRDCVLRENAATNQGGGLHSTDSNPHVTRCVIAGNVAEGLRGGGGVYSVAFATGLSPEIDNCLVVGNSALNGGGCYANASAPRFEHCTFAANSATTGGALHATGGADPLINQCILWDNAAPDGPQIRLQQGNVTVTVRYSAVQGGLKDITGPGFVLWKDGNIGDDPQFVDPLGGDGDPLTWPDQNYRLLQSSPAIDTGDPDFEAAAGSSDLDGNPRVLDGALDGLAVSDMGCYEFDPPLPACLADLDGSGNVEFSDLAILLMNWGPCSGCAADLDGDQVVDHSDLAQLLGLWGACPPPPASQ